jgi:hypothetical protein
LSRMVIEETRCRENSRLHRDWRAGRPVRVGCRRPVSARQIVVVSRLWGSHDNCRTDRYRRGRLIALVGWLRWVEFAGSHDGEMRNQRPTDPPKYQRPSNGENSEPPKITDGSSSGSPGEAAAHGDTYRSGIGDLARAVADDIARAKYGRNSAPATRA